MLQINQEVFVYFNLHKKLFSIRDVKTGRVVAHLKHVLLSEATFKVSEAGRQRVLLEKRKNVHAGVRGKYRGTRYGAYSEIALNGSVRYNPYETPYFIDTVTQEPVHEAQLVFLTGKSVMYSKGGN